MNKRQVVVRLQQFVARLIADGVRDGSGWRDWRNCDDNEAFLCETFGYKRKDGMPAMGNLVRPFFHPDKPLVLLNYTDVAHRTLHAFPGGWTPVLRHCRGIVFDFKTKLVAMCYEKMFNHTESEAGELPSDEPFLALKKLDGHLLIVFWYDGEVIATTRGFFTSPSAKLANELLKPLVANWRGKLPEHITALFEFIHPETHVIVDYGDQVAFVLTGAYDLRTLRDLDYEDLSALAKNLGVPVVEVWKGNSLENLLALEKDPSYRNEEGHMAWFLHSRKRVKIKSMGYISRMIGDKLNHLKVMQLLVAGNFESKLADLAEEVRIAGGDLKSEVMKVTTVKGGKKDCWQFLYDLLPEESRTDYNKGICRQFYKWLVQSGEIVEDNTAKATAKKPRKSGSKKPATKRAASTKRTSTKRTKPAA